uniref:Saposin B-type domain-containing protein n=1 Tax=Oryza meridionalis TaxID=40149 RepID=A0A0E0DX12_9ORYZ
MYRSSAPPSPPPTDGGSSRFRPSMIHAIRQLVSESPTARARSFHTCAQSATKRVARRPPPAPADASSRRRSRSAASMRYRRRWMAAAMRGLIMVAGVNLENSSSSDGLNRGGDRGMSRDRSSSGSRVSRHITTDRIAQIGWLQRHMADGSTSPWAVAGCPFAAWADARPSPCREEMLSISLRPGPACTSNPLRTAFAWAAARSVSLAANHVMRPTWPPPIGRHVPELPPLTVRSSGRAPSDGADLSRHIGSGPPNPTNPRAATLQVSALLVPQQSETRGRNFFFKKKKTKISSEMARGGGVAVAMAVAVAAAVLLLHPAAAAAAGPKKVATAARKEDIPYIRCQVCERIAREISAQVAKKQQALPPTKKVPEIEIIEIAENVCNLKKQEADWMLKIDIVEKGDKLEVMGYADTDVAEFVYKKKPSADQLVKFLCKDLSEACAVDPPPVPKDRVPGEPFAAKPSKDAEMDRILKSMEGIPGAPSMKMYSRDDLMKNNFGVDGDDDDDDEDEEDDFPKNLGNVFKDEGSPKKDLKQQVVKQIKDTGKKLKGHVNKVSKVVKKWWQGKKKPSKSSKTEL